VTILKSFASCLLILVLLVMIFALPACAQSDPRVKLFGGFAAVPTMKFANLQDFEVQGATTRGFTLEAGLRVCKGFSLKADYTDLNSFGHSRTYLGGVEWRFLKLAHTEAFVHGLAGATRSAVIVESVDVGKFSLKNSEFAAAIGGGLDVPISKDLGIRLVQFDFFHAPSVNSPQGNNFRVATGLVIRF
jgi:hypothetical protein